MRTALRWLRRALLGLGALLLLLLAGAGAALWWSLPPERATLRLAGLAAPVEIGFDAAGVPLIRAGGERDAWVAIGWLHARDRLFQMELMRRGAAGRLSEIAGAATLRSDRFVRLLGLARRAEADLAALPAEARDALEAYASGVNAWIAARGRFAAPEFLALGAPEPWRPADSLLWGKVMGLWLSGNWRVELDRMRLLAAGMPVERMWELWPVDASPGRPDRLAAAAPVVGFADAGWLARIAAAVPAFPADAPLPASASNAWAVAPARSASGGALLANDPHLGFGAPILWYLLRIELPHGRFLAGATSPGVPLVVIGRNQRLAWGFTTTHSDTQDLVVERLAGPDAYQTPDGPRPFTVREERIGVRGAAPVSLRVRETRHGPVLSDLDGWEAGAPEGTVLALAMANLAPDDTAAQGLLALNRSGSVAEARAAAALITAPPQNLMVADADGRIALYLTGRTPLRRGEADGALPRPGWDGSADWAGWVAFEAMPHVEDPPGGVIATANNRVAPADAPVFLGRDWFGDWRFRRIGQRLAARERHDAAGFAAIQMDTVSLHARELLPPLLRLTPRPEGEAGVALDLLRGWDGTMAADRPQPLIFHAWTRAFGRAVLAHGGVPEGFRDTASPEFLRSVLAGAAAGPTGHWCGEAAACGRIAAEALGRAVAGLRDRFGPDPALWRWGGAHVARFEHPLLRALPLLGRLTGLSIATPGDSETINRGSFRAADFSHVQGAGLRAVFDLGEPEGGVAAVIATGQSGHPLSRHWGDLLERWRDGVMLDLGPGARGRGSIRLEP